MKKLLVLAAGLALVPALVPAKANALTLGQRVTRLENKMACLRRYPVTEFGDFAAYVNQGLIPPVDNEVVVWDEAASSGNPDSLQDAGAVTGLDFDYFFQVDATFPPDRWLIGLVPSATCTSRFRLGSNPNPRPVSRLLRARQLARVQ